MSRIADGARVRMSASRYKKGAIGCPPPDMGELPQAPQICKPPHLCASLPQVKGKTAMAVLEGFRAVQVGPGLAAAVCVGMLADVGANVARVDPDRSTPLADYLTMASRRPGHWMQPI